MSPHTLPSLQSYSRLMAQSFQQFTGLSILGITPIAALSDAELARAMFEAPQAIVSHGTELDPIFRYGNATALRLWEMEWADFTRLPSRLSAESVSDIQSDRDALLKAALVKGWVDNYSGIRISRSGRRFDIQDTVLWNVVDTQGVHHGQAAFIRKALYL